MSKTTEFRIQIREGEEWRSLGKPLSYSNELFRDLSKIQGLDSKAEYLNILSTEVRDILKEYIDNHADDYKA